MDLQSHSHNLIYVSEAKNLIKNDADQAKQAVRGWQFCYKRGAVQFTAINRFQAFVQWTSPASTPLSSRTTSVELFQKQTFEFLTGEKDYIPEFQFNWISPEAPAIQWPVQPPAHQPVVERTFVKADLRRVFFVEVTLSSKWQLGHSLGLFTLA